MLIRSMLLKDCFANKSGFLATLLIIWIVLGLIAFVYSLLCIGKTKSTTKSILGVVLAVFLGPFYFVYLLHDKSYCRDQFLQEFY